MSQSKPSPSRLDPPPLNRRSFLSLASLASFFGALGVALAGMLRLPNPAILPGPIRRYKIGLPEGFPVGSETRLEKENVFVFRDAEGLYAISAVCTHLGCSVSRNTEGFACPCHGSRFTARGRVVGGPAPRALARLEVGRAADGQLVVFADNEVPEGTRFRV
ncbi:MAG: Rieske 2Fe-2S domain-containing protein [Terriglobia bacterium]